MDRDLHTWRPVGQRMVVLVDGVSTTYHNHPAARTCQHLYTNSGNAVEVDISDPVKPGDMVVLELTDLYDGFFETRDYIGGLWKVVEDE